MTPPFIVINKPVGQTPLQAMQEWKVGNPEFAHTPATYAGRLDPMASGLLIVLLGEECKKREKYNSLDKEYLIEVVLDCETDTGDALGLAKISSKETVFTHEHLHKALNNTSGSHSIEYPAFSSKTVNGKPLFLHALEGTLDTITIPKHIETIYSVSVKKTEQISHTELQKRIISLLTNVPRSTDPSKSIGADFRQDEIRAQWAKEFNIQDRPYTILILRVTCATGTYMRTLATRIAKELGTTGFALSITRTKIGKYRKVGPFGFWAKRFN